MKFIKIIVILLLVVFFTFSLNSDGKPGIAKKGKKCDKVEWDYLKTLDEFAVPDILENLDNDINFAGIFSPAEKEEEKKNEKGEKKKKFAASDKDK